MASETEKTLLIYGFNNQEEEVLKRLSDENNLPQYKVIKDDMGETTVRDILLGKAYEKKICNLPKEKVVLFNGCEDSDVMNGMKVIKDNFNEKPIFAVVTPTSIGWKFKELLEHLMQEREWYESRKKQEKR
ncbi:MULTISPECIES: DUF3783 domain-containing protein [Clostridium]|jgi:hypothetical protein|uniref:DUF3783 domain-containing protein n=2 Tax=Clostridium TaxID=1485 RepID=A0A151AQA7_9CLOT|nr:MULTISPECIES: DUF3783 domain-containing protein [Clostridium]KYH29587.1 hypothetical protein CLCOL_08180 [Clostridium colicanis DSM 13634]MBE6043891.1 DUF3783 domain-containing protein [Clostridium thermopalmarium]PRR72036.1 hypothetical protein CPAL_15230 [Clostridium thermopalmarium DSM 5974]PVZ23688.1 uncharacterized protein DUF3783 [Clostridium thermopalmarium DSM 5974]